MREGGSDSGKGKDACNRVGIVELSSSTKKKGGGWGGADNPSARKKKKRRNLLSEKEA